MRRMIILFSACLSVLFGCESVEARGSRHSLYRHINSRGHVSYYHRHEGGRHFSGIDVSLPIEHPHKYISRYICYGAKGPHYCYRYPSDSPGLDGIRPDSSPSPSLPTPNSEAIVSSDPGKITSLALYFGYNAAIRAKICSEPKEKFNNTFYIILTDSSTIPISPLGEEAYKYFLQGLQTDSDVDESCQLAKDKFAKAMVRFLSAFYLKEERIESIYKIRLGAARYEMMCKSEEIRVEGEMISSEMIEKLGLTSTVPPTLDEKVSEIFSERGEDGCITSSRIARW